MGTDITKYREIIDKVIRRYAGRIPDYDKPDLRQEAELALWRAEKPLSEHPSPNKLAYKISRDAIIDSLRKKPPREDNIDDEYTRRKYEQSSVSFPDPDAVLDGQMAVEILERLAQPFRFIIQASFGVAGVSQLTEEELSATLQSPLWLIKRQKRQALERLRELMGVKH